MESKRLARILTMVKLLLYNYRFNKGMCDAVSKLQLYDKIDQFEKVQIIEYLDSNIPTKDNEYKEFTESPYWRNPTSTFQLWWDAMAYSKEARVIRINYLKKLIANIK